MDIKIKISLCMLVIVNCAFANKKYMDQKEKILFQLPTKGETQEVTNKCIECIENKVDAWDDENQDPVPRRRLREIRNECIVEEDAQAKKNACRRHYRSVKETLGYSGWGLVMGRN